MDSLQYISSIHQNNESVVTIGNFDGVHIGHRALISHTLDIARAKGLESIVFSYDQHTKHFFHDVPFRCIYNTDERDRILYALQIDTVLHIPMDESFRNLSAEYFLSEIIQKRLKARHLVLGEDARMGRGGSAQRNEIRAICQQIGLDLSFRPLVRYKEKIVSSSWVRSALKEGDIPLANHMLCLPYHYTDKVIQGKKLGRKLGFPTANMHVQDGVLFPRNGVYGTMVQIGTDFFHAATNVGINPSIAGKGYSLETHIIDYSGDLYGQTITIYFYKFMRDEMKFSNLTKLTEQMKQDVSAIKHYFIHEGRGHDQTFIP